MNRKILVALSLVVGAGLVLLRIIGPCHPLLTVAVTFSAWSVFVFGMGVEWARQHVTKVLHEEMERELRKVYLASIGSVKRPVVDAAQLPDLPSD